MERKGDVSRNRKWMRKHDEQQKSFNDQYPEQLKEAREQAKIQTPLRRLRAEADAALERREEALLSADNAAFNEAIRMARFYEEKLQGMLAKRRVLEETIFQSLVAEEKQRAQHAEVEDEREAKKLDPLVARIEASLTS